MKFVRIPSGTYRLGFTEAELEEIDRVYRWRPPYACEPLRKQWLNTFVISVHPVTNREFSRFIDSHPMRKKRYAWMDIQNCRADAPVSDLAFVDAERYARWMGARLPSADEWEAAARGPQALPLPWGNAIPDGVLGRKFRKLPNIGSKPRLQSEFGLQELVGFGHEWTSSEVDGKRISMGIPYWCSFERGSPLLHIAVKAAYRPKENIHGAGFRLAY